MVATWRNLTPKGRFLAQEKARKVEEGPTGEMAAVVVVEERCWNDVGDKKAREKASQCLRERSPDVIPFVKTLELELTLEDQEKAMNLANNNNNGPNATVSTAERVEIPDPIIPEDESGLTSSDITKHSLSQQKQAAIAAHKALTAYIPPDLMETFGAAGLEGSRHPLHSEAVSALSMQREKIAREIRDLKRQKAQIQAEIEEKKMIDGGGTSVGQCGSGGVAGRNAAGRGKNWYGPIR